MRPPEDAASQATRAERPAVPVLDNRGQPVGGDGPRLADGVSGPSVDARLVQGKVCYGLLLFSNAHALSGRDPVRVPGVGVDQCLLPSLRLQLH